MAGASSGDVEASWTGGELGSNLSRRFNASFRHKVPRNIPTLWWADLEKGCDAKKKKKHSGGHHP